ncbi:MAG TPA: mechanosensitive ion channel domain-containing protein, partial [Candidatus Angelobacter sp.]|nr:mechanosensitive ion channel domain-containing protein [Candidatus Angelobacter sp.]
MFLMRINTTRKTFLVTAALLLVAVVAGVAQNSQNNAPSGNGEDIIPFLNQTIVWSRQLAAQQQLVSEPSDALFLNDNRQTADQVVKLGFDFARARAQALASQGNTNTSSQSQAPSQFQRLSDAATKADQRVKQSQQELDTLHQQLATATGAKRRTLQATIDETQSEMELFQARRDALRNMLQFAAGTANGVSSGSLLAQIEELAHALPAANSNQQETNQPASNASVSATAAATREHKDEPNGIFSIATDLFTLRRKLRALDDNLRQTDQLEQTSKNLRAPLLARMRELTQAGDQLSDQADSQDPAALAQQRKNLDALTAQFKQLTASMLPLSKQNILLDVYKRSTMNWRNSVETQYQTEEKSLLLRLVGLALVLGLVFGISEVWKRATFRYITDTRRRYQFLLIRRIVLWCMVVLVVAAAFASELGAVTTFAGLLTAGIAVALQNVILSIAGYFFLIGKYGVRVGDRVQIADVKGDVVDIGLVRLHIMEVTSGPAP